MKKLVALFLCLMLVWCTSAVAEPFVLRNGILFGDTAETVAAKETSLEYNQTSGSYVWYKGHIAGHDNVDCRFDMDDSGHLTGMLYVFGEAACPSLNDTNSLYASLKNTLISKYGEPVDTTNGLQGPYMGAAFDNAYTVNTLFNAINGVSSSYVDCNEWFLDVEGGMVKIEIVSFYWGRGNDLTYNLGVGYTFFPGTPTDVQAELDRDL